MITSAMVYWITRLDTVQIFLLAGTIVWSFFSIIIGLIAVGEKREELNSLFRRLLPGAVFPILLIFTPSTKEMVTILILPKIANSELVQEIPQDLMEMKGLVKEWLKDKLKEKK